MAALAAAEAQSAVGGGAEVIGVASQPVGGGFEAGAVPAAVDQGGDGFAVAGQGGQHRCADLGDAHRRRGRGSGSSRDRGGGGGAVTAAAEQGGVDRLPFGVGQGITV